jgi:hypothetical protein
MMISLDFDVSSRPARYARMPRSGGSEDGAPAVGGCQRKRAIQHDVARRVIHAERGAFGFMAEGVGAQQSRVQRGALGGVCRLLADHRIDM